MSKAIFALAPPSAAHTVPTCTCYPRPWLPFHTRPENPVATFVLVWKLSSFKYESTPRSLKYARQNLQKFSLLSKVDSTLPSEMTFPQLGNHFRTQQEGKSEALPGTLMNNWEFGIYKGEKFRIVSAMPLFGITKGVRWDVAKHIQIYCHMRIH